MINEERENTSYQYHLSLCLATYVFDFVEILKGRKTEQDKTGAVKPFSQAFQDYVFYKNANDLRFGPQLLYYPCTPTEEELEKYQNTKDEDLPYVIANARKVRSLLGVSNLPTFDLHPMTDNLKPIVFGHATILDCIFANANTEPKTADANRCLEALNAFLELYKTEFDFKVRLSNGLLSQAMANANPETRKYIIRNCPEFYQYLPAQIFKDRPFELFDNRVFRVNNLEYQKIALEAVPIQDKAELEEIIETKNTEAKQELTNSSAHTK